MKHDEKPDKKQTVLIHLSLLPQKILSLHGRADLTEFVLSDLCQKRCFNLKKAAFFVDNPDFNCLKGIAGYSHQENPTVCDQRWDHPERFMARIKESSFNRKVRELQLDSLTLSNASRQDIVNKIAGDLAIDNPQCAVLPMKHNNHGLLIFQKEDSADTFVDEHLSSGLAMLGFCPIY